ncbi:MAG: hypothetical protein ACSHX8_14095 [Opitutaceae bacterium]
MNKAKIILLCVVLVCGLIFCLQNTLMVQVKFLFFEVSISRALLIFVVFIVGWLSGALSFRYFPRVFKS